MKQDWLIIIDVALLSMLLGIATLIKSKIGFIKRFPVPIPIIAGFLGLFLGKEILHLIDFDNIRLENMVYHLMSIGFISLSLKSKAKIKNSVYLKSGMFIVSTYAIQGVLGFGLSLLMAYTFFPDLFPPFGLLLPLGYGQGPGQAYAIGSTWEGLGFKYGGNMGLTLAALGYIWACIGGLPLIQYLKKRKKSQSNEAGQADAGLIPANGNENIFDVDKVNELPHKESIDGLSLQLILIGFIYLLTYLSLLGLNAVLIHLGSFGQTLAQLLWGFAFIIGAVYGMAARKLLDYFKAKGIMRKEYTSNYLLERISGVAFDYMITAAIAVISLYMLRDYWIPVVIISTLGGLLSLYYCMAISRRIYKTDMPENILAMYGMLTGTISTGLALLREVDPHFKSDAARNLVFGSGTALLFGFPLMLLLNVPTLGFKNGNPVMYLYTMIGLVVYFIFLLVLMGIFRRRRQN